MKAKMSDVKSALDSLVKQGLVKATVVKGVKCYVLTENGVKEVETNLKKPKKESEAPK